MVQKTEVIERLKWFWEISMLRAALCVLASISLMEDALARRFCAISNFGQEGPCFSTLNMCQSWVSRSGAACSVGDTRLSQSMQGPDATAALREALRGLSAKETDKSDYRVPEHILERMRDENRKEIEFAIGMGCDSGVKASVDSARSWSDARSRMDSALLSVKDENRREAIRRQFDIETEKGFQVHLDYVYQYERQLKSNLESFVSRLPAAEQRDAYRPLNLSNSVKTLVYQYSAMVGWKNPGVSNDRLERLLMEQCKSAMSR